MYSTAFLTNDLFSFASLFTFYPLGASGADWADVSLTDREYARACAERSVNDSGQWFRNKTLFTLNSAL